MMAKAHYIILTTVVLGLVILNFLLVRSTVLGSLALIIFIVFASLAFGRYASSRLLFGSLATLSLIIITTSVAYLVFGLTTAPLLVILVLIGVTSCLIYKPTLTFSSAVFRIDFKNLTRATFVWIIALAGFIILYTSRTTEAIVSPWTAVPKSFFILLFLLIIVTFWFVKNGAWTTLVILPLFLLAISIALVVYKIGYGFDQFVHEAALRYIGEYGVITPRTPYYIGEYGLITFISKFAILPVGLLNKLLLPILFGTLVPLTLVHLFVPKGRTVGAGLIFLLFPLTPFIATTPQGLANLLLILLILVGWLYLKGTSGFVIQTLLAFSVLFIHVIAGIPSVIFLIFIYLAKNKALAVRAWLFIFAIGSLAIPALFVILSFVRPNLVQLGIHNNLQGFLGNLLDLGGRYNFWLDIVYLNKLIIPAFLLFLLLLGLHELKTVCSPLAGKDTAVSFPAMGSKERFQKITLPYFSLFGILLINFLLAFTLFTFPSLIVYEQGDFALRFFEMSFYFLIPILLYGGVRFFARLRDRDLFTRGVTIIIFALFITSSVYLSYPRKDAYDVSRGFSTSSHDIAAVHAIEKDAEGASYVVLANQAVGAAALREFGFSRTYLKTTRGKVYFYSIPTGGELYKYYLRMVYDAPRAEIARKAAKFAGVDAVYFIINDYWWNSKQLIEIAKQEAKDSKEIDGGKTWIFRY